MNELKKVEKTMSSREIAELTGKRHPDVKRDIRNLNQYYVELGMSRVAHSNYTDQQGKTQIEFLLTKIQTLDLMTGYSIQLRVKVNRRWEELEIEKARGMLTLPSRKEMALMILQAEEELEQANETIALQAPRVEFVEEVFEAKDLLSVGTVAKMLGTGQNRLFKMLRDRRILKPNNQPYQTFVERGYFVTKGTKVGSAAFPKVVSQTYVTTKGLAWIRLNIVN